jgi:hypothetical protein
MKQAQSMARCAGCIVLVTGLSYTTLATVGSAAEPSPTTVGIAQDLMTPLSIHLILLLMAITTK